MMQSGVIATFAGLLNMAPAPAFAEYYPFMEKVLNGETPVTENPTGL